MNDDDLRAEIDRLLAMQDGLRAALADAVERLVAWDSAHDERDQLRIQVDRLVDERDRLRAENERMAEVLRRLQIGPVSDYGRCPRCGGLGGTSSYGMGYRKCDGCKIVFPVRAQ